MGLAIQVYEALVGFNARPELEPHLAETWRLVDPLTWDFRLREGVRFHDGTLLTADDVVFSLTRALTEPSNFREDIKTIAKAEATGAHRVRITTAKPNLLLPQHLTRILIISRSWAEAHGVTRAADFGAGEQTYATHHANGTGPFVLKSFEPGVGEVMVRNPNWWGLNGWPHNVDRIVRRIIADPKERLEELVAGRIDFLPDPPFEALKRVRRVPGVRLGQTQQLRTIFLGMDQASAELRSSDVKGRNPFKDKRVRQALYQAIDIEAIRDEIMHGLSIPAGMLIEPGINGYSEELDRRLPHDPEAARALLAEAGYPDGFSITLDCPNNRYINDEAICRAVADQLGTVGIEVTVAARPKHEHFPRLLNRQSDFGMEGWTASTMDSINLFAYHFRSQGLWNITGYADPKVEELIDTLETEISSPARDALIEQVWRLVLDDIVYLPLHHQVLVWAMRDDLDLPVDLTEKPQFRLARFRNRPSAKAHP